MRYFKEIEQASRVIIKHNLVSYDEDEPKTFPIVNVFELTPLEDSKGQPVTDSEGNNVKFLVYSARALDRVAERLKTKGSDEVNWGDPLTFWTKLFRLKVEPDQAFEDVLNDLWGNMFNPGLAQDSFDQEKYGHSKYIQTTFIERSPLITVATLQAQGLYRNLRLAIRPKLLAPNSGPDSIQVFHINHKILEIQVPKAMDLMVVLRP